MRRKAGSAAKPYDTYAYWLMPHGLRGLMTTVFWPAARSRRSEPGRSESPRLGDQPAGARARYPGPRRAIPDPGPREGGTGGWESTRSGAVRSGAGPSLCKATAASRSTISSRSAGPQLLYWGTFRGNGYYDSEESHSFSAPFVWMDQRMNVGDFKQQQVTDSLFDPRLRRAANSASQTLRVEIAAHHDTWRDPDTRIQYEDVLEVHYWGRYPRGDLERGLSPRPWARDDPVRDLQPPGAERGALPVRGVLRALHAPGRAGAAVGGPVQERDLRVATGSARTSWPHRSRAVRSRRTSVAGPGPRTR